MPPAAYGATTRNALPRKGASAVLAIRSEAGLKASRTSECGECSPSAGAHTLRPIWTLCTMSA